METLLGIPVGRNRYGVLDQSINTDKHHMESKEPLSNCPLALWTSVFLAGFGGTITASTFALISRDLDAANNASWLTTSYLVTSTAFQALFGRFSDVFGRRACFTVSTIMFMISCLGCSFAEDMLTMELARALAGCGGGGFLTIC